MVSRKKQAQTPGLNFSPKAALIEARKLASAGNCHIGHPEVANSLRDLGHPGDELMYSAICSALQEAEAKFYQQDTDPQNPPAYIYIWPSEFFGRRMYLKFKLKGTKRKPVLWLYACHKAHF